MMANGSLLYRGEPRGNTEGSGPPAEQDPPKGQQPRLPGRASTPQGFQGPTQLSPEGLSHGPPLSLITLTLLMNSLHNQVHDVKQDPGNKSQLIMLHNREARERPGFSMVQLM